MNLIAIGFAGFLALVVLGLLLSKFTGFKPIWVSAEAKQRAAESKRRDQILKG
ncbi:hypothetical protein [Aquabacterium soli]|jgi:hypothetical protein|uniref:hypothetical protein n=1 Tax=Aquabacterium soli TaxID=2493092 RepID=UPI0013152CCD|nr:hypothetical protein [Aquabacterium soli]